MKYYAALASRGNSEMGIYFSDYNNVRVFIRSLQRHFYTSFKNFIQNKYASKKIPLYLKNPKQRFILLELFGDVFLEPYIIEIINILPLNRYPEERVNSYRIRRKYIKLVLSIIIRRQYLLPDNKFMAEYNIDLLLSNIYIPEHNKKLYKLWYLKFSSDFNIEIPNLDDIHLLDFFFSE